MSPPDVQRVVAGPGAADAATIVLTLAHSPDPDDAFMWWPLTGKIEPPASVRGDDEGAGAKVVEAPVLDTGRLRFRALAADIDVLNRRAVEKGDLEITALSVRTWAEPTVRERYAITGCGASFGDGYGPRLVARATDARVLCEKCLHKPGMVIAVPGLGTTAVLMLGLLLKELAGKEVCDGQKAAPPRLLEMPFDQIIGAVADGRADVGLVIHEGQLSFGDAGLCMIADVGAWWKERTGLKLPLGVNAVRRDLNARFGEGTLAEVSRLLRKSVEVAMERWDESVAYTLAFARANLRRQGRGAGGGAEEKEPDLARVERYCRMYVSEETRDMGEAGREAIRRLLEEGARAGLCEDPGSIDLV